MFPVLRRSRRSNNFWESPSTVNTCSLPCQRQELRVSGKVRKLRESRIFKNIFKILLKSLFPSDHQYFVVVKAGNQLVKNNAEIDLGDCSGHCIRDSSSLLRRNKVKTCVATHYQGKNRTVLLEPKLTYN